MVLLNGRVKCGRRWRLRLETKWRLAVSDPARFRLLTISRVFRPIITAYMRARGIRVGRRVRWLGVPILSLVRGSSISIADDVTIVSRSEGTALGVLGRSVIRCLRDGASIDIGSGSGLSGVVLCASQRITVGSRVLCGSGVIIVDTDFHYLDASMRDKHSDLPVGQSSDAVSIGDRVFIGARAIVLKGVKIGADAVIGAGSVVTRDVDCGAVVAGNPARVLRG